MNKSIYSAVLLSTKYVKLNMMVLRLAAEGLRTKYPGDSGNRKATEMMLQYQMLCTLPLNLVGVSTAFPVFFLLLKEGLKLTIEDEVDGSNDRGNELKEAMQAGESFESFVQAVNNYVTATGLNVRAERQKQSKFFAL